MNTDLIISTSLKPMPTNDEILVAEALAEHFQSSIKFVARGVSHTPDVYVVRLGQYWEIKNVRGNSPKRIILISKKQKVLVVK